MGAPSESAVTADRPDVTSRAHRPPRRLSATYLGDRGDRTRDCACDQTHPCLRLRSRTHLSRATRPARPGRPGYLIARLVNGGHRPPPAPRPPSRLGRSASRRRSCTRGGRRPTRPRSTPTRANPIRRPGRSVRGCSTGGPTRRPVRSRGTHPACAAHGANLALIDPPAEKRPISTQSKDDSLSSRTGYSFPLNSSVRPEDLPEASSTISLTGNDLRSRTLIIMLPTAPVAPTTATL